MLFFSTQLLLIMAVGLLGGLGLLLLSKLNFKWSMVAIIAMVFISATGTAVDFYDMPYRTWIAPLSDNRSFLYMACGVGLALIAFLNNDRVKLSAMTPAAWLCFILSIFGAFIRSFHDGFEEGLKSLAFAVFTLLPLGVVVGALVHRWGDWTWVLRCIGAAGAVWTFASAVQFVLDRRLVTLGNENRFIGVAANPQHTSAWLAGLGIVVIWLALNDRARVLRLLWMGMVGAVLIMLAWTGSRTGAGMLIIGSGLMVYTRVGRLILLLPFAGAAMYVLAGILSTDFGSFNTQRLLSTEDTRTHAWWALIDGFVSSPVIGVGANRIDASENSFLLGASSFGAGFLLIMIAASIASGIQAFQLWRIRGMLHPRDKSVVDLIVGSIAAFFAGTMLEGYFAARISVSIVILVMLSVVGGRLMALLRESLAQQQDPAYDHGYGTSDAADGYGEYGDAGTPGELPERGATASA